MDADGHRPGRVRAPRVRDRASESEERIRFTSAILPSYARRSKSLEVLIPILSASTVARLKDAWADEHAGWRKRGLSSKRYVYFWVDGIHVQARLEDDAQCLGTGGSPARLA
jgi:putative transposase